MHSTYNINLRVGVAHVAYNTPILHLIHVLSCNNILIASCCDDYVYVTYHLIQFHNSKTIHAKTFCKLLAYIYTLKMQHIFKYTELKFYGLKNGFLMSQAEYCLPNIIKTEINQK
jgi:hypothetical protein